MSVPTAAELVLDSEPEFTSLLQAVNSQTTPFRANAWTNTVGSGQLALRRHTGLPGRTGDTRIGSVRGARHQGGRVEDRARQVVAE
jgi:hypothetical protein